MKWFLGISLAIVAIKLFHDHVGPILDWSFR